MNYPITDTFTIVFLVAILAIGIGVDFWFRLKWGEPGTISAETARWSRVYPLIPLLFGLGVGILAGHLWWPNFAYCH